MIQTPSSTSCQNITSGIFFYAGMVLDIIIYARANREHLVSPRCFWYVLLLVLVLLVYAVFRFCLCLLGEGVFFFVLCLLCPVFPVSLYCPFVIFPSGFSNVYLLCINVNRPPTYPLR